MDLDRRRRRGPGGRRSSRDRRPAPAHAANRGRPRAGEAHRPPERAAAERPLGRRHEAVRRGVRSRRRRHGGAGARMDRDAELLDVRDRATLGPGPPRRRLRPARPRRQRARGRARLRDGALRRGPRGGVGDLRTRRRARNRGRPLARRDVDRGMGGRPRCRAPGPRRRPDQRRRRRPDRPAADPPAAGVRAGDQQGDRGARLPRLAHAAAAALDAGQPRRDPLLRVRPRRQPGARSRSTSGCWWPRRPTRARASESRCPRWTCATRSGP